MYESKEVSVIPGKNCQCMCLFCQLLCLWKIIAKLMYAKGASDGARGASKHGMYAGEVPKNYVTHDKSLASKLLSCDVQKNCPGEDLDPGPTGEGCPSCCCSLSFFMGSLSFTISLHGFQNMWEHDVLNIIGHQHPRKKHPKRNVETEIWSTGKTILSHYHIV